ncbi:hypothetical protein HEB29_003565 [Streptomyces fulvorobeus]|uniref:Uncharacterized protein n=1 Tax=Streptomyces fulvorobeus TaxID=284028 RepID=A0A7Y9KX56_9ACTN|nr:hypothetical protein [Streptomyces fulvorobeus]
MQGSGTGTDGHHVRYAEVRGDPALEFGGEVSMSVLARLQDSDD